MGFQYALIGTYLKLSKHRKTLCSRRRSGSKNSFKLTDSPTPIYCTCNLVHSLYSNEPPTHPYRRRAMAWDQIRLRPVHQRRARSGSGLAEGLPATRTSLRAFELAPRHLEHVQVALVPRFPLCPTTDFAGSRVVVDGELFSRADVAGRDENEFPRWRILSQRDGMLEVLITRNVG